MNIVILLSIIAVIESSGNPLAYNPNTKATGLYQITPICLEEYNNYHKVKFTQKDLFKPDINKKIASWYLYRRIPEMLMVNGYSPSTENILICWNWGIGNFLKWKAGKKSLPRETKNFLDKYKEMSGNMTEMEGGR